MSTTLAHTDDRTKPAVSRGRGGAAWAVVITGLALFMASLDNLVVTTALPVIRVHLHAGKGRVAPFTVGSIRLDGGPIVRTLIVEDAGPLEVGARMVTTLASVTDAEGAPRLDLRFASEA